MSMFLDCVCLEEEETKREATTMSLVVNVFDP